MRGISPAVAEISLKNMNLLMDDYISMSQKEKNLKKKKVDLIYALNL
jgi:hypothetical protein